MFHISETCVIYILIKMRNAMRVYFFDISAYKILIRTFIIRIIEDQFIHLRSEILLS